jgi:hypothetical protein
VVAGESANDREVLRCFLEAFCPQMQGRVVFLNEKVPLRDASEANLSKRVKRFSSLVQGRAARERASIAAVFLHEDLDDVESQRYESVRDRVQRALDRELENVHYVLAAWEIEAWLLLFPDEIASFSTGWKVPARRRGRDTGKFQDPKRIFKDEISKAGTRYRESDAPAIADHIVTPGKHTAPIGSNRSFDAFRADAIDRCRKMTDSKS